MKTSTLLRMPFVLILIASLFLSILPEIDVEGGNDPLIEDDLVLEITSPIDSDPLLFSLRIPWGGGEPMISNVSYSISGSNFTELIGWEEMYFAEDNLSVINFPMHFDWGREETILVRVTDHMGVNSTVGNSVVCSRPPVVDIVHTSETVVSYPGVHIFSSSASDPDDQELHYKWFVDGVEASSSQVLSTFLEEGAHNISLEVTDGQWTKDKRMDLLIFPLPAEEKEQELDMVWVISLLFLLIIGILCVIFSIFVIYRKITKRAVEQEIRNGERKASIDLSSLTCDICLSKMKDGQSRTNCRCGAQFHKGCGRREGICPECGREILL